MESSALRPSQAGEQLYATGQSFIESVRRVSLAVLRFCPSIVNLYSPQNTTRAVQNVKDKDKTNDLVTVDTVGYSDDVSGVAMLLEMRLGGIMKHSC